MSRHIIYILLFTLNFQVFAQDAKKDLMKINEAYAAQKDLSMDITYAVFTSARAVTPLETHTGLFKQHNDMRYSKLKEIESLQNKSCSIVIDNEDQLIVVANPAKSDISKITLIDLDKSLTACSAVEYIGKTEKQGAYRLVYKQNIVSEYDAVELYFNKKTFLLEKMVMYYRQKMNLNENSSEVPKDKPRLEITFSNTSLKAITDMAFFSEERFIQKKKGKYYPVNAYNQYQLIDQKFIK